MAKPIGEIEFVEYNGDSINPSGKTYDQILVFTDGGCINNPGGVGGCGVVISSPGDNLILKMNARLEIATNNTAEYTALALALRVSRYFTRNVVRCYTDSKLVYNQLTGKWRIKKEYLRELNTLVKELMGLYKVVELNWTPRETRRIQIADELASQAIKEELILLTEDKI